MTYRVTLIGAGKAGSAVARALHAGGARVDAIITPHLPPARSLARATRATVLSRDLADIPPTSTLIIIATPDSVIASVATQLAECRSHWKRVTVAHLSGVHTRAALRPVALRGARTMALHPAFPFASRAVPAERLEWIGWGVDCTPADWNFAQHVVRSMHGAPVRIPAKGRVAYHTACAMLSNFTVVLAETASQVARKAGIGPTGVAQLLYPLLAATVENIVATHGRSLKARLTGPIARGDAETVLKHLQALKNNPAARRLYRDLAAQTRALLADDRRR